MKYTIDVIFVVGILLFGNASAAEAGAAEALTVQPRPASQFDSPVRLSASQMDLQRWVRKMLESFCTHFNSGKCYDQDQKPLFYDCDSLGMDQLKAQICSEALGGA